MNFSKVSTIVVAALIVISIPVAVILTTNSTKKTTRSKASGTGDVSVFFKPQEAIIQRSQSIKLNLQIDTSDYLVGTTDLILTYDPNTLNLQTHSPETAFPTTTISPSRGQILIHTEGNLLGQGSIASLTFTGIRSGTGSITITQASTATDKQSGDNISLLPSSAAITIK